MDSTQHKEGSAIEKMIEYLNGLLKIEDDLILTNSKNEDAVKDIKENWQQLNRIKEMALTIQKKYATPPTGNERTAQDCTDGKAEHEGGELDKKNPNYIHNLFMRNADVWTDEHGWMMRIDRFKEVARQLNNLLNF